MGALEDALAGGAPLLTDGGIETRIMFGTDFELDPHLQVAAMVSDAVGRPLLREVYESYVRVAEGVGVPIVIGTPTFRASRNFAEASGRDEPDEVGELNRAAAAMHTEIRAEARTAVVVAGVLGPARDAYTPAEAIEEAEAAEYHREQAGALAEAGVDFLFAATFPAVEEAVGAAHAMGGTGLPYVVSLVLNVHGDVLDGTSLAEASGRIRAAADPPPAFLSISCVHPSVAATALHELGAEAAVWELKANGSRLPTEQLVQLDHPDADPPEVFADEMWELHERFGLRVIGGCCGTDDRHIAALAERIAA